MRETITINRDIFEEIIRKKEELDEIIESIELINNKEVQESIKSSKEDIADGRIRKLRDVLENGI